MRARLSRLHPRHLALLVLAAAAVSVAGCQAGESGSGTRGQSGPPMTLTLSAAKKICETKPGQGYIANEWREDDDGREVSVDVYTGWPGVAEIDIRWSVSGGTGPYELEIDGETRDPAHEYKGATGTASVSCALTTGETYIDDGDRRYMADPPLVDSGRKTIRATVTDSTGATAEATLDTYVVLIVESSDIKLRGGETYRVNGFLMTIPDGIDMETGDYEFSSCEGDDCEGGAFQIRTVGDGYEAYVYLGQRTGRELTRLVWLDDRPRGASEERHPVEGKFDELVESIGRLPQISVD